MGSFRRTSFVRRSYRKLSYNLGITYKRYNNISSILVLPEELLLSHMEVVNGHEFLFNPLIRDNKLFGRGSIDVINALNFINFYKLQGKKVAQDGDEIA